LLRLLTPLMKLTTAKQAVSVASEVLEACGGAGYVEDTGLPVLLRDSQVLPIWEGTTNVLALDTLRALGADGRPLRTLRAEVSRCLAPVRDDKLAGAVRTTQQAFERAEAWLAQARQDGQATLEAGARALALTLGRATELALLLKHAQWSSEHEGDGRAAAAARLFAGSGIDLLTPRDIADARLLLNGQ
jgi:hypothetical protein